MEALTPDQRADIIAMAERGIKCRDIGLKYNRTKNSIIGIINRERIKLGKPPREKRIANKPHAKKPIIIINEKVSKAGITIFKLNEKTCRYMIGHHKYCGHAVEHKSYCMAHAKECYNLDAIKKHRRKKA